jgi:DNA-binding transcriptional LysR family regulator
VSKAIIELEHELGIDIFARHGKRLKRITEPGQHVLQSIEIIMREIGNLKRIGEQYSAQHNGTLSIATTHTQARYVLPEKVARLRASFPKVNVSLHQGAPDQVARMLIDEVAEIGIATESLASYPELVTLPCYEWQHMLVMPVEHPLAARTRITLDEVAVDDWVTKEGSDPFDDDDDVREPARPTPVLRVHPSLRPVPVPVPVPCPCPCLCLRITTIPPFHPPRLPSPLLVLPPHPSSSIPSPSHTHTPTHTPLPCRLLTTTTTAW